MTWLFFRYIELLGNFVSHLIITTCPKMLSYYEMINLII